MSDLRVRSLFHSLVVVGASLTACGGKSSSGGDSDGAAGFISSSGGSASSGGSVSSGGASNGGAMTAGSAGSAFATLNPLDCGAPSQWTCSDYSVNEDCHCNDAAPTGPQDCSTPFDFTCDWQWAMPSETVGVGCRCDPMAVRPDQCAFPEQFTCDRFTIFYSGCRCNPDAARLPSECGPECSCGTPGGCDQFRCQSELPRYGCACERLACIK